MLTKRLQKISLIFILLCSFSCSKEKKEASEQVSQSETSKEEKKEDEAEKEDEEKKEPVSNKYNFFDTIILKKAKKVEEVSIYGRVKTLNNAPITASIQGKIIKLFVKNGDYVKKGQLIAEIDEKILLSQAKELQADAELAKSEVLRTKELYDSAKKLYDIGLMPKQDYDNAYFNMKQAKIKVEAIEAKISSFNVETSYNKVEATNTGYLLNLLPVGTVVGPGLQPVANINTEPSDIEFKIPFNLEVKLGKQIFIENKPYGIKSIYADETNEGKIALVSIKNQGFQNSQPIKGVFKKEIQGLTVPSSAVLNYEGKTTVFEVSKEKDACVVNSKEIKVLFSDNNSYLISGLKENTKIISKGAEILEDKEMIECEK